LNINPPDIETSDAQKEDGKMTSEDSYMIATDRMVCHDADDEDDEFIDGSHAIEAEERERERERERESERIV
jgi:hypothetical protein